MPDEPPTTRWTRRRVLNLLAGTPVALRLLAASSAIVLLEATPAVADDDEPTPAQAEGPYFTPSSPRQTSLVEAGVAGTRLALSGRVLSRRGRAVPGALVDLWQADGNGEYDNRGFRLRGHQFTDLAGRYAFATVVPGLYPGRTRHLHVKVQAPGKPVLTTQLYFPGEPGNATDRIYHPRLEMTVRDAAAGRAAAFDFVLDV